MDSMIVLPLRDKEKPVIDTLSPDIAEALDEVLLQLGMDTLLSPQSIENIGMYLSSTNGWTDEIARMQLVRACREERSVRLALSRYALIVPEELQERCDDVLTAIPTTSSRSRR